MSYIMDTMTSGRNSESWCGSRTPLNMTGLDGSTRIRQVSCDPHLLFYRMAMSSGGGLPQLVVFPGILVRPKTYTSVILLCV
jgi:hypothetical protein